MVISSVINNRRHSHGPTFPRLENLADRRSDAHPTTNKENSSPNPSLISQINGDFPLWNIEDEPKIDVKLLQTKIGIYIFFSFCVDKHEMLQQGYAENIYSWSLRLCVAL